jgi:hypothetical protein
MRQLVDFLTKETEKNLSHMPYRQVIEACGGSEAVVDVLQCCIDPGVKALEGKIITTKRY